MNRAITHRAPASSETEPLYDKFSESIQRFKSPKVCKCENGNQLLLPIILEKYFRMEKIKSYEYCFLKMREILSRYLRTKITIVKIVRTIRNIILNAEAEAFYSIKGDSDKESNLNMPFTRSPGCSKKVIQSENPSIQQIFQNYLIDANHSKEISRIEIDGFFNAQRFFDKLNYLFKRNKRSHEFEFFNALKKINILTYRGSIDNPVLSSFILAYDSDEKKNDQDTLKQRRLSGIKKLSDACLSFKERIFKEMSLKLRLRIKLDFTHNSSGKRDSSGSSSFRKKYADYFSSKRRMSSVDIGKRENSLQNNTPGGEMNNKTQLSHRETGTKPFTLESFDYSAISPDKENIAVTYLDDESSPNRSDSYRKDRQNISRNLETSTLTEGDINFNSGKGGNKKTLMKLSKILLNSSNPANQSFRHKNIDRYLRYEHSIYQISRIFSGSIRRELQFGFEALKNNVNLRPNKFKGAIQFTDKIKGKVSSNIRDAFLLWKIQDIQKKKISNKFNELVKMFETKSVRYKIEGFQRLKLYYIQMSLLSTERIILSEEVDSQIYEEIDHNNNQSDEMSMSQLEVCNNLKYNMDKNHTKSALLVLNGVIKTFTHRFKLFAFRRVLNFRPDNSFLHLDSIKILNRELLNNIKTQRTQPKSILNESSYEQKNITIPSSRSGRSTERTYDGAIKIESYTKLASNNEDRIKSIEYWKNSFENKKKKISSNSINKFETILERISKQRMSDSLRKIYSTSISKNKLKIKIAVFSDILNHIFNEKTSNNMMEAFQAVSNNSLTASLLNKKSKEKMKLLLGNSFGSSTYTKWKESTNFQNSGFSFSQWVNRKSLATKLMLFVLQAQQRNLKMLGYLSFQKLKVYSIGSKLNQVTQDNISFTRFSNVNDNVDLRLIRIRTILKFAQYRNVMQILHIISKKADKNKSLMTKTSRTIKRFVSTLSLAKKYSESMLLATAFCSIFKTFPNSRFITDLTHVNHENELLSYKGHILKQVLESVFRFSYLKGLSIAWKDLIYYSLNEKNAEDLRERENISKQKATSLCFKIIQRLSAKIHKRRFLNNLEHLSNSEINISKNRRIKAQNLKSSLQFFFKTLNLIEKYTLRMHMTQVFHLIKDIKNNKKYFELNAQIVEILKEKKTIIRLNNMWNIFIKLNYQTYSWSLLTLKANANLVKHNQILSEIESKTKLYLQSKNKDPWSTTSDDKSSSKNTMLGTAPISIIKDFQATSSYKKEFDLAMYHEMPITSPQTSQFMSGQKLANQIQTQLSSNLIQITDNPNHINPLKLSPDNLFGNHADSQQETFRKSEFNTLRYENFGGNSGRTSTTNKQQRGSSPMISKHETNLKTSSSVSKFTDVVSPAHSVKSLKIENSMAEQITPKSKTPSPLRLNSKNPSERKRDISSKIPRDLEKYLPKTAYILEQMNDASGTSSNTTPCTVHHFETPSHELYALRNENSPLASSMLLSSSKKNTMKLNLNFDGAVSQNQSEKKLKELTNPSPARIDHISPSSTARFELKKKDHNYIRELQDHHILNQHQAHLFDNSAITSIKENKTNRGDESQDSLLMAALSKLSTNKLEVTPKTTKNLVQTSNNMKNQSASTQCRIGSVTNLAIQPEDILSNQITPKLEERRSSCKKASTEEALFNKIRKIYGPKEGEKVSKSAISKNTPSLEKPNEDPDKKPEEDKLLNELAEISHTKATTPSSSNFFETRDHNLALRKGSIYRKSQEKKLKDVSHVEANQLSMNLAPIFQTVSNSNLDILQEKESQSQRNIKKPPIILKEQNIRHQTPKNIHTSQEADVENYSSLPSRRSEDFVDIDLYYVSNDGTKVSYKGSFPKAREESYDRSSVNTSKVETPHRRNSSLSSKPSLVLKDKKEVSKDRTTPNNRSAHESFSHQRSMAYKSNHSPLNASGKRSNNPSVEKKIETPKNNQTLKSRDTTFIQNKAERSSSINELKNSQPLTNSELVRMQRKNSEVELIYGSLKKQIIKDLSDPDFATRTQNAFSNTPKSKIEVGAGLRSRQASQERTDDSDIKYSFSKTTPLRGVSKQISRDNSVVREREEPTFRNTQNSINISRVPHVQQNVKPKDGKENRSTRNLNNENTLANIFKDMTPGNKNKSKCCSSTNGQKNYNCQNDGKCDLCGKEMENKRSYNILVPLSEIDSKQMLTLSNEKNKKDEDFKSKILEKMRQRKMDILEREKEKILNQKS